MRRRSAAKAAAVLGAARVRFAEDGLEGASMERVAAEARVSTATLYRLFPSKLHLFEAVLREGMSVFAAELGAAETLAPHERLSRLATAYATLLDDPINAGILRAVLAAAPRAEAVARVFHERVKTVVAGAFHAAVADAAAAGLVRLPADAGAPGGLLMGAIEHATLWRRLLTGEPGERPPAALAAGCVAAFWAAYGA